LTRLPANDARTLSIGAARRARVPWLLAVRGASRWEVPPVGEHELVGALESDTTVGVGGRGIIV
jgi:hypothetical protein